MPAAVDSSTAAVMTRVYQGVLLISVLSAFVDSSVQDHVVTVLASIGISDEDTRMRITCTVYTWINSVEVHFMIGVQVNTATGVWPRFLWSNRMGPSALLIYHTAIPSTAV